VRRELCRHGATRWYSNIVRAVFDAATDPARVAAGVADQRAGALERTRFALADLAHARAEIAVVEARMVAVLEELDLTSLATSIPGLSAVGAAASLPRPATQPGSPAPGRWSSTQGSAPATTPQAPTRARPGSVGEAAPSCASRRGERCGPRCGTTPCSPPGTHT
jgi:transposase